MRPTLDHLNSMFDQFNQQHFDGKISKVPVLINERLTATAGRAWAPPQIVRKNVVVGLRVEERLTTVYVPEKIEISGPIFDHNGWDFRKAGWPMTELEDTVVHEMTHLYLMEHFQDRKHSTHFHNIMSRITGVYGNHRCHSMARAPRKRNVAPKRRGGVIGGLGLGLSIK